MKKYTRSTFAAAVLGFGLISPYLVPVLLADAARSDQEILFESEESKSASGEPIFNKVKFLQSKNGEDIWMMNQSQHGSTLAPSAWDRLAIVVSPEGKTAKFYQLAPGPLEWTDDLPTKSVPLKVSCFLCHSNGPRVIRPNFDSVFNETSISERVQIFLWNQKIKSYGQMEVDTNEAQPGLPVRFQGAYDNQVLKVNACLKCHNSQDPQAARASLTRQNLPSIRAMLERGHMPPFGHFLSKNEKRELESFLAGF